MEIQQLHIGDRVEGFYLLQSASPRVTNSGKPYLTVTLADRTGSIDGQCWDYAGPIGSRDAGEAVKVRGVVGEFRGAPQFNVERIRLTQEGDPVDPESLVPVAPLDADAAWDELLSAIDSIEDTDYAAVCRELVSIYGDRVRSVPAAKSVHHSFLHGLLMHTLFMLRTADYLADQYAAVIDRSLLLAGTLLHDFAKTEEFTVSSLGLVTEYSTKGQLLGHLVMGAQAVAAAAERLGIPEEKSMLLQHMLLSHHGEPEFGAAVRPQCAEAELLSSIDTIDSRMEIYRETLQELEPGTFSKRIFALDRRVYRHL